MEFRPGAKYLQVKVATKDQGLWAKRARELGALETFYDQAQEIFILTFEASNINETLRRILDAFPEADILEAGLSSAPRPAGYRKVYTKDLIIVSPGPEVEPRPGEVIIRSNLSFGSGYHPTTELSIKLIPEAFALAPIKTVFDLGTGSGILALCAARLGAERILAADIDYRACKEALHNVSLNQARHQILVVCGSYDVARPKGFDLLLANLTIGVMTGLAPSFPDLVKEGGLAILSGFTSGQVPEVLAALGQGRVIKEMNLEGWAGLLIAF